ncbi:F-box domain and ankyrin repeat protein [Talaromyces pinophilus]|uniref:F-box domain and ankyrin repeat protein n=1 Tax=Talaromyces pinophilus TaxID=128442 RepID=A0A0B8N1L2_TALPI|nr:F-box domain and ankyrin repeat protein [Talaromyces pinophilus]
MDRPTSSSIRNRGERPAILVNSAEVELSDIPPPGSPAAESVGNVDIINGNTELRRQLSSHSRNREFTENDRNDDSSIYDTVSDVTVVTRSLRTWDVAALIINKMIGTGIFTTPGVVLSLTGSKSISIILWVVGGVHTLLCLTVYLEFGAALPYTGGELIYLDEMYYRPELLATIIFSGFFICFGTSTSNSIAFARYIILAAEPNVQNIGDLDGRLVGYIAITINVATCLFLYFSNGLALALNRLNALYKIGLLLAVFIAGAVASREPDSGIRDFDTKYSSNSTQTLSALVYILFAYQGWENANYVAGEIKAPRRTLRNGAYLSGAYDMMKLLLSYGADPNLSDLDDPESTPLSVAAELGMSELVCLLIDKGANVHQRGVLGKICAYCNMEALQCAVDLGVDLDTLDSEGVSLLYHAAENEDVRVLKYLLQACHLTHQINDPYRGITPLLMAITAERSDNIMVLLDYGADVTILHPTTLQSVLHLACTVSLTFESVKALVQAGANIGLEDHNGLRPLHRAVIEDGCTALHYAMQVVTWDTNPRRRDTAKLLLAAGAPLRVKDNYGCTPISEALEGRQFEFLYWMVTGDLDFCEKDSTFTDHEKAKWLAYREEEYRLMSLGFDDD